ncbi:MAG: beta-lactamase family protein [Bacteroidales bacterium]|nr:beta-lactamase family protein [Bacteroidales bacterium]
MLPHRCDKGWMRWLLTVCLTMGCTALSAQSGARDSARMQLAQLFQTIVKEKRFNGSMLVADDQGVLFQRTNGYARLAGGKRLHAASQFEVASVSKQFTAISILMLQEAGLLSLEDSLERFFPFFPYHGITIRQLLCHRSGLPDYLEFALPYSNDLEPMSNEELLQLLTLEHPEPESPPDTRFSYSNTGYAVLASVVEKVSGLTFEDFVLRNIFEPLEMNHSRFFTEACTVPSLFTIGHRRNKSVYERDALSGVVGDKGIMTTTADLHQWFFHIGALVSDSTLAMAWTPQNGDMDSCANYGFGWRLSCDAQGNRLVYHGGLWNGNHCLMLYRPCDHTFLLFLSNWCNGAFQRRSDTVLEIMNGLHAAPDAAKNSLCNPPDSAR